MPEKVALRAALLAARRAMGSAPRRAADAALTDHIVGTALRLRASTLAGYVPMAGEPGGPGLLPALAEVVPRLLVPVLLADRDLDWARWTGPDSMGPPLGPAAITAADLVIVPAVAVDVAGMRLGRGGGSYDRALVRVGPQVLVVAVVYDDELVESLPGEGHDRRVGAVITPSGGLRRLPQGVDRDTITGR